MRIEYDLKFKDVVLFQAIHQFLSPAVQAVFLLAAGFVFHAELGDGNEPTLAPAVALTFYVAFWLFQLPFNAVLLVSRKNGNVLTRHSIELRPDGIAEETRFTQTFVRWPGIAKVVARPGFVAIYLSSQLAHVVPNRAFPSAKDRSEFLAAVRRQASAPAA